MTKIYTAQEMREMAERIIFYPEVQAMLRQAADDLEREEKSEMKHEYKVLYCRSDGRVYDSVGHAENIHEAQETLSIYKGYKDAHIVRRKVGEWKEVSND